MPIPKIGAQDPATGDLDQDDRTAEDKLVDLEADAAKAAGAVDGEGEKTGDADPDAGVDDDASVAKVKAFMLKKGINDLGKLVDIASELETRNTKLDQDVRRLSAVSRPLPVGGGSVQPGGKGLTAAGDLDEIELELPDNPIDLVMDKAKLKKFALDLIKIGEGRQAKRDEARNLSSVQARVQAKMEANPEEFEELRSDMLDLSKLYPDADIDQLYEGAKAQRERSMKSVTAYVKKELGLDAGQTERLKAIATRLRTTPISGGTGVQVARPAATAEEKDNRELLEAIRNADRY